MCAATRTFCLSRPRLSTRTTSALVGTFGARPDGRLSILPAMRLAVGTEQTRNPDATGILTQPISIYPSRRSGVSLR